MDDAQRAHFREKGWVVIGDALDTATIASANEIYDGHLDGSVQAHPEDAGWDGESLKHYWYNSGQQRPAEERHLRQRVLWGQAYYDMVAPATIVPVLEELLGDEAWGHCIPGCPPEHAKSIRLDHDNTHFAAPFDATRGAKEGDSGGARGQVGGISPWTPDGVKIGGIHGGDPVATRTISVIYELVELEDGCGGE